MSTSHNHFETVFKNSCLIRPINPATQLPATTLDYTSHDKPVEYFLDRHFEKSGKHKSSLDHPEFIGSPASQTNNPISSEIYDQKDLPNLLQNDTKFYRHLQELRHENKKTLKMLETVYKSRQNENGLSNSKKNPSNFISSMRQDQDREKNSKLVQSMYDSITSSADQGRCSEDQRSCSEDQRSCSDHIEEISDAADEFRAEPFNSWQHLGMHIFPLIIDLCKNNA